METKHAFFVRKTEQFVPVLGIFKLRLSPESKMSNQSRDGHGVVEVMKSFNPHQPLVDIRGSDSELTKG